MSHEYTRRSGEAFKGIAGEYDRGRRGESVGFWVGEARRLAGVDEDSIVLDLGCGTGLYTAALEAEAGCMVVGVDPVANMLSAAREKSHSVHWLVGLGEALPLRSGVVDLVFSSQVWHHIEDKQAAALECGRVLVDGGVVVVRTIGHEQLHRKVVFEFFPEIKENQLRVYPTNQDFQRYFTQAGFRDVFFHEYQLERYQTVDEFIEVAEKKLWSMFRSITPQGLRRGVELLEAHRAVHGEWVRNDELITLVVAVR